MYVWKLARKDRFGKYHPLYVNSESEFREMHWYFAEEGPRNKKSQVISKLGGLCYRPGIHASVLPIARHIGEKHNGKLYMRPDSVWLHCYIPDSEKCCDEEAREYGRRGLPYIPSGWYHFKTTASAEVDWIITRKLLVVREVPMREVNNFLRGAGIEPQPRWDRENWCPIID